VCGICPAHLYGEPDINKFRENGDMMLKKRLGSKILIPLMALTIAATPVYATENNPQQNQQQQQQQPAANNQQNQQQQQE
jgi:hypothetical protein